MPEPLYAAVEEGHRPPWMHAKKTTPKKAAKQTVDTSLGAATLTIVSRLIQCFSFCANNVCVMMSVP